MKTSYTLRYMVEGDEVWRHLSYSFGSLRDAERFRAQLQDDPAVRQITLYEERVEAQWIVINGVWTLR